MCSRGRRAAPRQTRPELPHSPPGTGRETAESGGGRQYLLWFKGGETPPTLWPGKRFEGLNRVGNMLERVEERPSMDPR